MIFLFLQTNSASRSGSERATRSWETPIEVLYCEIIGRAWPYLAWRERHENTNDTAPKKKKISDKGRSEPDWRAGSHFLFFGDLYDHPQKILITVGDRHEQQNLKVGFNLKLMRMSSPSFWNCIRRQWRRYLTLSVKSMLFIMDIMIFEVPEAARGPTLVREFKCSCIIFSSEHHMLKFIEF